jgi:homoserine/homoserine lactone efflux protein
VAYLIYLGCKQFTSRVSPIATQTADGTPFHIRALILHGWLVNVTNPKGTIFLLAVVPQFLNLAQPLAPQYLAIAGTLSLTDLVAMGCYTSLSARILKLMRSPLHIRWLNRSFGALFILAGVVLASFSHHE